MHTMQLMLTHVTPPGPRCQAALNDLKLPQLHSLLRLLGSSERISSPPDTLSPLSEQLQAGSLGLQAPDGLLPWAALEARRLQLLPASATQGWAWITPCEWKVHSDHVSMCDPQSLALDASESATLLQAMRGYFAEDGLALYPGSNAGTWLACGALLKDLPTASLERAIGSNSPHGASVDRWLCRQPQARPLRRLQNEMQMLLYTHPVNTARAAARRPLVSAFWVSGTGELPPSYQANQSSTALTVLDRLRDCASADDDNAWCQAWKSLDQDAIAPLLQAARSGTPVVLTLCGTHAARQFHGPARGLWQRMHNHWHAAAPKDLLRSL